MAKREKPIQHPDYEKAPMDRRTFLTRLGIVSGITAGTGYISWAPEHWPLSLKDARQPGMRSLRAQQPKPLSLPDYRVAKAPGATDVGIARADRKYGAEGDPLDFTDEQLKQLLHAAIDLIAGEPEGSGKGIQHFIEKDDIVLIKPNVAFDRSPNLGATSNPVIVKELIRLVLEAGAQEVRVADNPIESPPDCFRKSKIGPAAADMGARLYMPDSNSFRMLHTPGAALIEDWWFFHRPFTNVDKVIGISPVKDHNLCHASIGFKNWYGLLGGTRNQFHQDINGIISDFALMIKPTFAILDGTNVLMENGPTGGDPSNVRQGNVVIATLDQAASDSYAFEKVLLRPAADQPEYIRLAVEKAAAQAENDALDALWREEGRLKAWDIMRRESVPPDIAANEMIEQEIAARAVDANWRNYGRTREVHV